MCKYKIKAICKYIILISSIGLLFTVVIINREHPKIKELFTFTIASLVIAIGWVYVVRQSSKKKDSSTPKIQELTMAFITALIIAVAGMYILGDETDIATAEFSTVYFVSNENDKPIFSDAPILMHHYLKQNLLYSELTRDANAKPADKQISDRRTFFRDLQAASIVEYLMSEYSGNWFIERVTQRFPGHISKRGKQLGDSQNDTVTLSKDNLSGELMVNRFFKYINSVYSLTLPKDTIVTYKPYADNHKYCQIELKKPFYFTIDIRIYYSSYTSGLGDIAPFFSLSSDENDRKYGSVVIDTYCEAKFDRLLPGNPILIRYKEWVNHLFQDLDDTFSWQVCYENIKDYLEFRAYQIINGNRDVEEQR